MKCQKIWHLSFYTFTHNVMMKKFMAFVLGFTILAGGSVVFLTDASRFRPFSNRIGHYQYRGPSRGQFKAFRLDSQLVQARRKEFVRKYRYPKTALRQERDTHRLQRPHLFPRERNVISSKITAVQQSDYLPRSPKYYPHMNNLRPVPPNVQISTATKTYGEADYTLNVPTAFESEGSGKFSLTDLKLDMQITKLDSTCQTTSFQVCIINYGKHFRSARDLTYAWDLSTKHQFKKIIKEDETVLYPTLTEAFFASDFGIERIYIAFNALNPSDGSITRIEVMAPARRSDKVWEIVRPILSSFQFQI